MNRSAVFTLAALAALATLTGCEPLPEFERIEVTSKTTAPLKASVAPEKIEITHGNGLALSVRAFTNKDNEAADPTDLVLSSSSPNIKVNAIENGVFLLFGVTPGDARLDLTSSTGAVKGVVAIPVTVLPQEP
jgi:hypothetical protein